jgi:hypothetical protein
VLALRSHGGFPGLLQISGAMCGDQRVTYLIEFYGTNVHL